ncbi:hypothetical protein CC86DRAFT_324609 [Ophiobolus disseminans]|uniref:Uncharacterized protein n=1 Tax=Ophiobolus disseminans TaxID=1469910 RepID=A0A6A6ZYE0_9PLEO|nr:hypothetical protein CC86DRAFT_324609 [Ophiobolus disseminans]
MVELLMSKDLTTMHLLVKNGELSLVKVLVATGYNLTTRDSRNQSALHIATLFGHLEIASVLISAGIEINCKDDDGNTPLRLAIVRKSLKFIDLFLRSSASTTGIQVSEWRDAYDRKVSDIVRLGEGMSAKKTISFIENGAISSELGQVRATYGVERRLFVLPNSESWQRVQLGYLMLPLKLNTLHTSVWDVGNGIQNFVVVAWFPACDDTSVGKHFKMPGREPLRIAWRTASTWGTDNKTVTTSSDHFSNLSNGWLPRDGPDFFAHFLDELGKRWRKVCDLADQHLTDCRLDQPQAKGESRELISRLAQDAQTWADLRRKLKDHVRTAQEFVKIHGHRSDNQDLNNLIEDLGLTNGRRIDQLEQAVRDLLQLEFAWVSINEAYRSTSLATSMKRLSWVTFIFLPAMFASSLFGMNVSILKDDPDWRWFLIAGAICLSSTMGAWLIFKCYPIEAWLQEKVGQRLPSATKSIQVRRASKGSGIP